MTTLGWWRQLLAHLVEWPSKRVWWISAVATVALIVVTLVVGVVHGAAKVGLIIIAAVLALLQFGVQVLREAKANATARTLDRVEEETRRATNEAVAAYISPILRLVLELLETGDDQQMQTLRAEIVTSVVHAAASAIGPEDGVRASFFKLEVGEEGPSRLYWSGRAAGRRDEPRSEFVAGTPAGQAAIDTVVNDTMLFCRDVDSEPPPGWTDHPHNYRTFLSAPVRGAQRASGMLSVDALNPGDLDEERDGPLLQLLARILAVSQISEDLVAGR